MLKMLLTKGGYEVVVEKNGLKIYEIVKEIHPDVVLLDAVLPGLDGYSIQKKLFADKENVVGFISKPFNITELQDKIRFATKG